MDKQFIGIYSFVINNEPPLTIHFFYKLQKKLKHFNTLPNLPNLKPNPPQHFMIQNIPAIKYKGEFFHGVANFLQVENCELIQFWDVSHSMWHS